jgi:hypothetical protein
MDVLPFAPMKDVHYNIADNGKVIVPLTCPCNLLMAGESGCGKTFQLELLLKHSRLMLTKPIDHLLIFVRQYQPCYLKWKQYVPSLEIVVGLQRHEEAINALDPSKNSGVIYDDLQVSIPNKKHCAMHISQVFFQEACLKDPFYATVITSARHRGVVLTVSLWHNAFPQARSQRTISLNMHCYVLMRSGRIRAQIGELGRQLGKPFLLDAYNKATLSRAYSYLLVDGSNRASVKSEEIAVRSNIFPEDGCACTTVWQAA